MKDRIEKAVELFKSGYNCSQSVVAAFADMYGFTEDNLCVCPPLLAAVSGGCVRLVVLLRYVLVGGIGKRRCRR